MRCFSEVTVAAPYGPDLQQIGAAWDQRMIAHPDHVGCELVENSGGSRVCKKITARDVEIGLECESDRLTLLRSVERASEGDDLLELRGSTRTCHQHCLAGRDRAGNYCAREAAELAIRAVDPLHWETEWPFGAAARHIDKIEVIEEGRTLIPRHPSRRTGNIVAKPRRKRDCLDWHIPKPRCEGRKARRDFLEEACSKATRSILLTASTM
jgi:hypothetical protein